MTEFKARVITSLECRECGAPMEWVGVEDDGNTFQCTKCDCGFTDELYFTFKVEVSPVD